ncbi:MAG: VOC family protein [Deltaproteobacteria bacterium]|nr:VOC family protein [Deltaproteobacteria bacterium]
MYKGSGVHHVGMGVRDYERMTSFYGETLAFKKVFAEFPEEEQEMNEVFRMPHVKFKGIMFQQKAGGVVLELIRMTNPVPKPIRRETRYGDIGVAKITISVSDVETFYSEMRERINFCAVPKSTTVPGGADYHFLYAKDPEGNFIEFVSSPKTEMQNGFGGTLWIGVSVSDLDRSMSFYQQYLGFDSVVLSPHDSFSGLVDEISHGDRTEVRSCLLSNSKGGEKLELFEVQNPRGRSIPFSSYWGDFGYLEVALLCSDIHEMGKYFEEKGIEFVARPTLALDEPDFEGWYLYLRDPDGILVEVISMISK